MKTIFDADCHRELLSRLSRLTPETKGLWGKMTAPQMIVHLTDQMTHALGDISTKPVKGLLRWAIVRHAAIYWVPWPKGRARGPVEAFVTQPKDWSADIERLKELLNRFVKTDPSGEWAPHALFGSMTGRDWGAFCYKHFDHHFRQFGV